MSGDWRPIFLTQFIAVAGSGLLQVVISRQVGADSLGLYYLALKLVNLPNEFAVQVVGSVAFPLYARLQNDLEQLAATFRAAYLGILAALAPVYGLLIVLSPRIVESVLGSAWDGTAPIITVLAIVGAIPFALAEQPHMTFTDAMFESTSGLTTTGATVLTGLDELPVSEEAPDSE